MKDVLTCNSMSFTALQNNVLLINMRKFLSSFFSSSTTIYHRPLQFIVMDIWGPALVQSYGSVYFLAFIDTYSRFTWLYFLHKKSDALSEFKEFKLFVEININIKSSRCNLIMEVNPSFSIIPC